MQIVTSKQIQAQFSEFAEQVKDKAPIAISQSGKPTMILMRYDEGIEALRELSKARLLAAMAERRNQAPASLNDLTLDELQQMIDEARHAE